MAGRHRRWRRVARKAGAEGRRSSVPKRLLAVPRRHNGRKAVAVRGRPAAVAPAATLACGIKERGR
jgi:hypothetical protein